MTVKKIVNGFLALVLLAAAAACGNANPSAQTPAGVTAAPVGSGSVNVSWTAAANATSYVVYYGTNSGITPVAGNFSGQVSTFSTSVVISGLADGTTYYFIVTAISSSGQSGASQTVSATPSAVAFIAASAAPGTAAGTVVVSWQSFANAVSYNIFYSQGTDLGSSGTAWPSVSAPATSATVTGLTSGQTYYFTVTASVASTSVTAVAP